MLTEPRSHQLMIFESFASKSFTHCVILFSALIVGISVAAVIAVLVIVLIVVCVIRRRKHK